MAAVPLTDIKSLRSVLSARPLGLFSDIDGTLSPIVPRPDEAKVTPRSRALLRHLMANGVRVAVITGRTLDVARSMMRLSGVAYAANHGLDFWVDGSTETEIEAGAPSEIVDRVLAEAGNLGVMGVTVEVKGVGVAFHYRRASDEATARDAVKKLLESLGDRGLQRMEGRKVIEVRPDWRANKGTAARRLAQRLGVRGIICVGDDRTDIDMFEAVRSLSTSGAQGCAVAVLSPEIAPDLLAAADYTVEGVEGVEWLLGELVKAVAGTSP
jgi:trehalose 6-phosphate phosphatase